MSAHPTRARRQRSPLARAVVAVLAMIGVLLGAGSVASAGGWAVTTLDPMSTPIAGRPVEVGFTIRQHGVEAVDAGEGVAIDITAADGTTTQFPAVLEPGTTHYVAVVVFPTSGTYEWTVQQGWFGPQQLGSLDVDSADAAAAPAWSARWPTVLGGFAVLVAGVLAAAAAIDAVTRRRTRRVAHG